MSTLIGRRRVVVAIILVLLTIVTTETVVLATTLVRQGPVEYMKVATTSDYAQTTSTSWTDVPGTAIAMPVPSGEHDFFQITFSTLSTSCARTDPGAFSADCFLRVLVDGQPVTPQGAAIFGVSSMQSYTPLSMQWVSSVLAPGTHYVKVQWELSNAGNGMAFAGQTLTVVRVKAF